MSDSHFDQHEITHLWKDSGSGLTSCPALNAVPGGYLVVGTVVDEATVANLQAVGPGVADNERVVFVPANVLDRLRGGA